MVLPQYEAGHACFSVLCRNGFSLGEFDPAELLGCPLIGAIEEERQVLQNNVDHERDVSYRRIP